MRHLKVILNLCRSCRILSSTNTICWRLWAVSYIFWICSTKTISPTNSSTKSAISLPISRKSTWHQSPSPMKSSSNWVSPANISLLSIFPSALSFRISPSSASLKINLISSNSQPTTLKPLMTSHSFSWVSAMNLRCLTSIFVKMSLLLALMRLGRDLPNLDSHLFPTSNSMTFLNWLYVHAKNFKVLTCHSTKGRKSITLSWWR